MSLVRQLAFYDNPWYALVRLSSEYSVQHLLRALRHGAHSDAPGRAGGERGSAVVRLRLKK